MTSTTANIPQTMADKLQPEVEVLVCGQDVVVNVGEDMLCLYTEAKLWLLSHFGPDILKLKPSAVLYEATKILSKTPTPGVFWRYRYEQMLATGRADDALLVDLTKVSIHLSSSSTLVHAIERQHYVTALNTIEKRGIPVDGDLLKRLRMNKSSITSALCALLDATCPFSRHGKIDTILLSKFIKQHNLLWPVKKPGHLNIDVDTLEEMALSVPCLRAFVPNYKLLKSLMREKLELGADSRVRCHARPFATKTGRNAPSSNAYILSLSKHYRSLIQPAPGRALAVIDFCSQDIGIAAAMSGDTTLLADYFSEDIYLRFMVQAGLAPEGATKATHSFERDIGKVVMLGVAYGMKAYGVAHRLNLSQREATNLILAHQRRYPRFWAWQGHIVETAASAGLISTQSGWCMRVDDNTKESTLKNWPIQATGADILRKAVLLCQQAGVQVIATNHDALMIESDLTSIERITQQTEQCMAVASEMVIGVALKTESSICKFPDHLYPQHRAELEQLLNLSGEFHE